MTEPQGDTGNVGPVFFREAGPGVAEFVRVAVLYAVLVTEFFKIPGWALRMDWVGLFVLRENPLTDTRCRLYLPEVTKHPQHLRVNVDCTGLPIFRKIGIYALRRSVLQTALDCHRVRLKVEIRPLQATGFTFAHPRIT